MQVMMQGQGAPASIDKAWSGIEQAMQLSVPSWGDTDNSVGGKFPGWDALLIGICEAGIVVAKYIKDTGEIETLFFHTTGSYAFELAIRAIGRDSLNIHWGLRGVWQSLQTRGAIWAIAI